MCIVCNCTAHRAFYKIKYLIKTYNFYFQKIYFERKSNLKPTDEQFSVRPLRMLSPFWLHVSVLSITCDRSMGKRVQHLIYFVSVDTNLRNERSRRDYSHQPTVHMVSTVALWIMNFGGLTWQVGDSVSNRLFLCLNWFPWVCEGR